MIRNTARFFRFATKAERLLLGYMAQGATEEDVLERWRSDLKSFTLGNDRERARREHHNETRNAHGPRLGPCPLPGPGIRFFT